MLDANLQSQLKTYLERVTRPIQITAHADDGAKSQEMLELLQTLDSLSDKISLQVLRDGQGRVPSFDLGTPGQDIHLTFAGLPMGHEFTSLVLALLQVGGHPSKATAELIEQVQNLEGDYRFETYFSLSCQNCPDVVQALNLAAVLNPRIQHVAIDGALFQDDDAVCANNARETVRNDQRGTPNHQALQNLLNEGFILRIDARQGFVE